MTEAPSDRNYALLEVLIDRDPDCAPLNRYIGSRPGLGCTMGNLMETLEVLTTTQLELFWSKMNELAIVNTGCVGLADDSDEEIRDAIIGTSEWKDGIGTLGNIAQAVSTFLEKSESRPKSLFTTLVTLHDILTLLNCDDPEESHVQGFIAKACEGWWLQSEHGRELVVSQLIAYLLLCAVERDDNDVFVKRLHGIKTAFQLLDFDDDSIESIRGLLLRCFVHPRFLKIAEGRRFLSYSFTFHEDVQELAVEVIKPQIAGGAASLASAYGDVLYRGWRESENAPGLRQHCEDLLQSLAHDAIHAVDQRYFQGLRTALRVFHDSKRLKDVDSLLLRIYGPILWRSLRCANALVRVQAATIFFDAFPIQEGSTTATSTAENDILLQRQFDLLKSLLEDGDHRVRAVAASGCCRVLSDFWEAVPPAITHQLLSFIAGKLGCDASSSIVRLSVVHGLHDLLGNPRSHAALKSILPAIAHMLHDYSDKVRAGFVKILTKVKSIRGFHFYDVVPIDVLLSRLATDEAKPAVCEAMTELLLNSFYPQSDSDVASSAALGPLQTQRCLSFLAENETAALAFYSYFYKHTSVGSAVKMSVLLLEVLDEALSGRGLLAAMAQKANGRASDEDEVSEENTTDKSNKTRSEKASKLLNHAKRRREIEVKKKGQKGPDTSSKLSDVMLRSVLRTIRVIITSISSKIVQPSHVPSRTMLAEYFSLSKLLELLPRIVDRDVEDARDVIMNVTYFMELVGQLTAIHVSPVKSSASKKNSTSPTVTPYYMQLSLSCVSAAIKTMADRGNEMGLIQYSPLSHAVVSIVCLLKCEDLLLSLFRATAGSQDFFTENALEWFPGGSSRRSAVSVSSSAVFLLLSAVLNGMASSAQASLRQRIAMETDLKNMIWSIFSHAQMEIASSGSFPDTILLEYIQLGSSYASLASVTGQGGGTDLLDQQCHWVFEDLSNALFYHLEQSDNESTLTNVKSCVETIYVAILPITDLLACRPPDERMASCFREWARKLCTIEFSTNVTWKLLWRLYDLCGRLCCLFAQASDSMTGPTPAEDVWSACLFFMVQFTFYSDSAVFSAHSPDDETIRSHCKETMCAVLQNFNSRPQLEKSCKALMHMLVLSALSASNGAPQGDKPLLLGCLVSKKKFIDATQEVLEEIRIPNESTASAEFSSTVQRYLDQAPSSTTAMSKGFEREAIDMFSELLTV